VLKEQVANAEGEMEKVSLLHAFVMLALGGEAARENFQENDVVEDIYQQLKSVRLDVECEDCPTLQVRALEFCDSEAMRETRLQLVLMEDFETLNEMTIEISGVLLSLAATGGIGMADIFGSPHVDNKIESYCDDQWKGDQAKAARMKVFLKMLWAAVPVGLCEELDATVVFGVQEYSRIKSEGMNDEDKGKFWSVLLGQAGPGTQSALMALMLNNGSSFLEASSDDPARVWNVGAANVVANTAAAAFQWMGGALPLIKDPHERLQMLKKALAQNSARPDGVFRSLGALETSHWALDGLKKAAGREDVSGWDKLAGQSVLWQGTTRMSYTNAVADALTTMLLGLVSAPGLPHGPLLQGKIGAGLRLLPSNAGEVISMGTAVAGGKISYPAVTPLARFLGGLGFPGIVTGMNDKQKHEVIVGMIMAGMAITPDVLNKVDARWLATMGRETAKTLVPTLTVGYDAVGTALQAPAAAFRLLGGQLRRIEAVHATSHAMAKGISKAGTQAAGFGTAVFGRASPTLNGALVGMRSEKAERYLRQGADALVVKPAHRLNESVLQPGMRRTKEAFDGVLDYAMSTDPRADTPATRYIKAVILPNLERSATGTADEEAAIASVSSSAEQLAQASALMQ